MELILEKEKDTKNTVRFQELAEDYQNKIGTIYIPKSTLYELGYEDGDKIKLSLEVEKD